MTKPRDLYCRYCGKIVNKKQSFVFCSVGCATWQKIEKGEENECWEWKGWLDEKGYGKFRFGQKHHRPYRTAYESINGPLGDLCALHKCDNRKCCNPSHIFPGTRAENVYDMDFKKRRTILIGSKNGNAILDEDRAKEIKRLLSLGEKMKDISVMFEVSYQTIQAIKGGRLWKHI